MTQPDKFRKIKLLFGTLDDLCQQRRRVYTEWVTGKLEAPLFASQMRENLRLTREAADDLDKSMGDS